MSQTALPLAWRANYAPESYIVADCNSEAATAVGDADSWRTPITLLLGDKHGGKTHLAHIFARNYAATFIETAADATQFIARQQPVAVIDDIDDKIAGACGPEILFHLVNDMILRRARLLLTATKPPAFWCDLPDLTSRLNSSRTIVIAQPDEDVIKAAFQKLFIDRGLIVDDKVLDFLTTRSERSFGAIAHVVDRLDRLALETSRKITVPLILSANIFS